MIETKTHCSCGRKIADNWELRSTILSLEKSWENASTACNIVAGERNNAISKTATEIIEMIMENNFENEYVEVSENYRADGICGFISDKIKKKFRLEI